MLHILDPQLKIFQSSENIGDKRGWVINNSVSREHILVCKHEHLQSSECWIKHFSFSECKVRTCYQKYQSESSKKYSYSKILWHSITETSYQNRIPCLTPMVGLCKPRRPTEYKQNVNLHLIILEAPSVHIGKITQKTTLFPKWVHQKQKSWYQPNFSFQHFQKTLQKFLVPYGT